MTHKSIGLILLLAGLLTIKTTAQYNRPENRVWAIPHLAGLDFTTGTPQPITTSLANPNEACASVCDTAGNLLFYTNGMTIWDASGDTLYSLRRLKRLFPTYSTISVAQGALIVPMPDSAHKYYVFSLEESKGRLYVNIIDRNLDNGNGDIDTNHALRNIPIDSNNTQKMVAVAGCENNVWVLVHGEDTTVFKAFEITASGLNLTPVLSYAGHFKASSYDNGVMKISPNRRKLLTCNFSYLPDRPGLEVYDFDYMTGKVSNAVILDSFSHYGGSFSPDNSKVYAQSTQTPSGGYDGTIYQYDLNSANPAGTQTLLGASGQYAEMKLGPDGKIYFGSAAGLSSGMAFSNYKYLGRIEYPDSAGMTCGFRDSVTSLLFLTATNAGKLKQQLPNEVAVPINQPDTLFNVSLDTVFCSAFDSLVLTQAADGSFDLVWDDGSAGSARTITDTGVYWLRSLAPCPRVDSFYVRSIDFPAGWSIIVNGYVLGTSEAFDSYQWYRDGQRIDGATSREYTVTENGWHSVKVGLGPCFDSLAYHVNNVGIADAGHQVSGVLIYPNPASSIVHIAAPVPVQVSISSLDGKLVLEHKSNAAIDISMLQPGVYIMRITDQQHVLLKTEKLVKTAQ